MFCWFPLQLPLSFLNVWSCTTSNTHKMYVKFQEQPLGGVTEYTFFCQRKSSESSWVEAIINSNGLHRDDFKSSRCS